MNKKPGRSSSSLSKLWFYMSRYKVRIFAVILFSVLSSAFAIIAPRILGMITTEIFQAASSKTAADFNLINRMMLILLCIYGVSTLFNSAQSIIMRNVAQNVSYKLRKDVMEKINRLPINYFDKVPVGETLSKVTNDVDLIAANLNQGLTMVISSLVTIVGIFGMMLYLSLPMTMAALLMPVATVILVRFIVGLSQRYFAEQQKNLGIVNGNIEEIYTGQAVVKSFTAEELTIENFETMNRKLFDSAWKSQFYSGVMMPMLNFVANLAYVAMAILGGLLAAQGRLAVGDILTFLQYVRNLGQPIGQTAQIAGMLQGMVAAADRVFEFLEEEEEHETAEDPSTTLDHTGDIVFDNIVFGYEKNTPVIRGFSLRAEAGSTTAIVGHTGAGKTTLVKLLMRFYDVWSGTIEIGGTNINTVTKNELRRSFGMVLQDTWLFRGTIMENIRYAKHDATDEEVIEAAKKAQADAFINQLPNGYHMELADDAANISEGQKQLITIARAILKNPDILILDEATSSVDTRTESMIQLAMTNLMKGRTNFVIAHRLSTIRNADNILVMEQGNIVEQGNHKTLLAQNGVYAKLYRSQFE